MTNIQIITALRDGNTAQLSEWYDSRSRSTDGRLYGPSLKWGGVLLIDNNCHSFGSPRYNTKGKAIAAATKKIDQFPQGIIILFARKQSGCYLTTVIEADK